MGVDLCGRPFRSFSCANNLFGGRIMIDWNDHSALCKNAVYKSFIFGFTGTSHKRFIVYLQAKLARNQERNGG
jgi:hypothetical protein